MENEYLEMDFDEACTIRNLFARYKTKQNTVWRTRGQSQHRIELVHGVSMEALNPAREVPCRTKACLHCHTAKAGQFERRCTP